jgi:hypothetical protein
VDKRDRKRHEQRKARQAAATMGGTEPALKRTRMEILDIADGVQVRRLLVDITEPLEAIVRWAPRAFLQNAPESTLRTLSLQNFDDDPRELWQIPEARAYLARLWREGKRVLQVLTESTSDTPLEDRHGLEQLAVSATGLGWLEVYLFGQHAVLDATLETTEGGPAWSVAVEGLPIERREAVRAELLEITEDNSDGYTFDSARERTEFAEAHVPAIQSAARRLVDEGHLDSVVLVLSLLDRFGRDIAVAVGGNDLVRGQLEHCRADDLHPGAVLAAPRESTARLLAHFAPHAGKILAEPSPAGTFWTVTVATGGTQVGRVHAAERAN